MILTTLVMAVVGLAAGAIILAVGLMARDVSTTPVDPDSAEAQLIFPRPNPEAGHLNEWFHQLLEESGSDLETGTALLIVAAFGLTGALTPVVFFDNYLVAAIFLVVGSCLPIVWWVYIGWRRCSEMRVHLAESLQMVADSVRAGHTLEEAADLVARELKGPLGLEFQQCAQQLKLGQAPIAVLARMSRRIPLGEFRVFATAVIVHTRTGGNLAQLTEKMAAASRDRQEFQGHLNAVTAGSRLSAIGLVAGAFLAVIALSWIEPDYMGKFIHTDIGPYLAGMAAAMQVVGALWVWQILKVNF